MTAAATIPPARLAGRGEQREDGGDSRASASLRCGFRVCGAAVRADDDPRGEGSEQCGRAIVILVRDDDLRIVVGLRECSGDPPDVFVDDPRVDPFVEQPRPGELRLERVRAVFDCFHRCDLSGKYSETEAERKGRSVDFFRFDG